MLSLAIWAAEQEYKAYSWLYERHPHGKFADMPKSHQAFLTGAFMLNASILGTGVALPYAALARASGKAAVFTAEFEAGGYAAYTLGGRRVTSSIAGRKLATRYVVTKIGSRFLGPVGVALLMYDSWTLGKWIGHKLFD